MGDVRITLDVAACLVLCDRLGSRRPVGQVQDAAPGTSSIGVSQSHGLGALPQEKKAMDAASDKAGELPREGPETLGHHSGWKHHHVPLSLWLAGPVAC
jgi:hypothetical protein